MNHLERFLATMEYQPVDRAPNWEAGAWPQTRQRWEREGMPVHDYHWGWFDGEPALGMDPREFIRFDGGMMPNFDLKVLEEDERTQLIQDGQGRIRRALKEGTVAGGRASMDQYLRFAVQSRQDWLKMKKRFDPALRSRYEANWEVTRLPGWRLRQHPLIFGPNCSTMGFYWWARELMGTGGLSFAWYDLPDLMAEMMEFWGDFLIETSRPVLEKTTVEYICLAEDLSMKNGPLLSPQTYRQFIWPHLRRAIEFWKSHGVRYVVIDTDGNPEPVLPLMMEAGVDAIWPMERAAEQDPLRLRKKFGRSLRLWGGVDKRELAKGPAAIDAHLRTLRPLLEEGGFIPTVDHTVPPDVSWACFQHYVEAKAMLLAGRL
jgi:uroporphyrinogen decarboxylase